MDTLGLSRPLKQLVSDKFDAAIESQSLIFSPTESALLQSDDFPGILLRYCPTLNKKPTANSSKSPNKPSKSFDPFASPSKELLVATIPTQSPSHNLVLNKFPVIKRHFILATIADEPQTGLLDPADLDVAYACVQAWEESNGGSLFAFFNSGEHSGASQPHRHIQFLPVEDMADDQQWHMLLTTMTTPRSDNTQLCCNEDLPFINFATSLSSEMSAHDLHDRYILLLKSVLSSIGDDLGMVSNNAVYITSDGRVVFSYNLAITRESMAILPRKSEGSRLPDSEGSLVAVNGTILAGTTMVKNQHDWQILRKQPNLVRHIFSDIAYPRPAQQFDLKL